MKKILHVIAQKPAHTGSGIYLSALIREGGQRGYSQALVAGLSRFDHKDDYRLPAALTFYPLYFDTAELPFPVVGMSDVMPYPSTSYQALTPAMYRQWQQGFSQVLQQAIDDFQPEIIIAHHLWLLTSFIKELAPRIPVIAIAHGTDLRQLATAPHFGERVIAGCQSLERIIALNEFQAEQIHRLYGVPLNKITVGGGGFNPEIFYPPVAKQQRETARIIYAGKLSYAKGVASLLAACELLYAENRQFELQLLGSGDGPEHRELLAKAACSSFPVTAPGAVSQRELGELFRQGDLFVLPSFYEGLSLVVIEALAAGLRVVTSDLPGLKPWLGETINQSGLISYVPLPALINTDEPVATELPLFANRLKNSIQEQMSRLGPAAGAPPQAVRQAIAGLTWSGLFDKIAAFFDDNKRSLSDGPRP